MHGSCFRTFRGQATAIATLGGKKGKAGDRVPGSPTFRVRTQEATSASVRTGRFAARSRCVADPGPHRTRAPKTTQPDECARTEGT
jgi:hypothetical protein